MLAAYIASLVLGLAVILFGIIAGGHGDADMHFDSHVEVGGHDFGHDAGGHEGSDAAGNPIWIPFLSPRFWSYFLGGFGLTGLLGTWKQLGDTPTLTMAVVTGFVLGLIVATSSRWLVKAGETTSTVRMAELVGRFGTVTVPIRQGQRGKVRIHSDGDVLETFASSPESLTDLMPGTKVIVVSWSADTLEVISEMQALGTEDAEFAATQEISRTDTV